MPRRGSAARVKKSGDPESDERLARYIKQARGLWDRFFSLQITKDRLVFFDVDTSDVQRIIDQVDSDLADVEVWIAREDRRQEHGL